MTKKLSSKDVSYAGTEWHSVGREPRVFEVLTPEELLGVHAELLASSLPAGEQLRHLLYSPIWDGNWAPFGISAQPASHALAVTDRRFLLSRDFHRDDAEPMVFDVPFDQVLWAECGSAHLLGWFSLYRLRQNRPQRLSVLFKSTGTEFFSKALRHYRLTLPRRVSPGDNGINLACWGDLRKCASTPEAREVSPMVLGDETLLGWLRAEKSWLYRQGFLRTRPQCRHPENLLLWTSAGIIHVIHEPDVHPKLPSHGLTVRSIPWQAVQLAKVSPGDVLHLEIGRGTGCMHIEVPFDRDFLAQAETLTRLVEQNSQ